MRSASIGTPAASRLSSPDSERRQSGFTLLEALVALAVVLAFAAALGPVLSQGRRIMVNATGRLAAQVLLRSLIQAPFQRAALTGPAREGKMAGLRWRVAAEPILIDAFSRQESPAWIPFRVTGTVAWSPGQAITAETVRLGKPE